MVNTLLLNFILVSAQMSLHERGLASNDQISDSSRDSPHSPGIRTSPSKAKGSGSIPGQEVSPMCHVAKKTKRVKQKQYCNKFNKD